MSNQFMIGLKNVTILILIDGFLQYRYNLLKTSEYIVTILILIDGFLQYKKQYDLLYTNESQSLILIDGFLQYHDNLFIRLFGIKSQSLF